MTVLVSGGAGYIGSHMAHLLLDRGEKVVVIDNLSTGRRESVADDAIFVEGNVGDRDLVRRTIAEHDIDAVIHFAGSIVVPESVQKPLEYYENNTAVSRSLVEAALSQGVQHFIFSSTAAVYGTPKTANVNETAETDPINPYGRSKLMTEWMLGDAGRAHGLKHVILRYFNVAGADPKGRTGQSNPLATHLIKKACRTALGLETHLDVFGTDFPTPDGTGVRDYIHVSDLADAHWHALEHLRKGGASETMNCGYGHGASVREVIVAVERMTNRKLRVENAPRRDGDPAMLVADPSRIRSVLGWTPKYDDLDEIVRSAFVWESKLASMR
jgi:UDP-glucose 4-epimerase